MSQTKIISSVPIIKLLEICQRKHSVESCDTHIVCNDGYIPCHRYVLMANSKFLKRVIADNIRDIGHNDATRIISISVPDVRTIHMVSVLAMFYSGKAIVQLPDLYYVMNAMKHLGVDMNKIPTPQNAKDVDIKSYVKLRHLLAADSSSDEDEEEAKKNIPSKFTTNAFVAATSVNSANAEDTVEEPIGEPETPDDSNSQVNCSVAIEQSVVKTYDNEARPPTLEPVEPKVAPISIKALLKKTKQTVRKRGKAQRGETLNRYKRGRMEVEPEQTEHSMHSDVTETNCHIEETESACTATHEKKSPSEKKTVCGKKSHRKKSKLDTKADDKDKDKDDKTYRPQSESDSVDAEEIESDDSALEILPRRKISLRSSLPVENKSEKVHCRATRMKTTQASFRVSLTLPKKHVTFADDIQVKCYFCDKIFPNETALLPHLEALCAKHLNGEYCTVTRECLLCKRKLEGVNLWGMIRHVHMCHGYGEYGTRSPVPSQKRSSENKDKSTFAPDSVATPNQISEVEDGICSDEEIQVVDSLKVKVLKQKEEDLVKMKNSIKEGKSEAHDPRSKVPPSTVRNGNSLNKNKIRINQITYPFEDLLRCGADVCQKSHSKLCDADNCLKENGLAKCRFCFVRFLGSIEVHYEKRHETRAGFVICPICYEDMKTGDLNRHIEKHFFEKTKDENLSKNMKADSSNSRQDDKSKKFESINESNCKSDNTQVSSTSIVNGDKSSSILTINKITHPSTAVTVWKPPIPQNAIATLQRGPSRKVSISDIEQGLLELEKKRRVKAVERQQEILASNINSSSSTKSSTALVPLTQSKESPRLESHLKFHSPLSVAQRFMKEMHPDLPTISTNTQMETAHGEPNNEPCTSNSALQQQCTQNDHVIANNTQPQRHFLQELKVPKVPGFYRQPESNNSNSLGNTNEINEKTGAIVPLEQFPETVVRSPIRGDRLYCGTISLENQMYRVFKRYPDSPDVVGTGVVMEQRNSNDDADKPSAQVPTRSIKPEPKSPKKSTSKLS